MSDKNQHPFWGLLSPFGGLMGASLLIMASARLSWAIIISGSLFWVYGLTTISFYYLLSVIGNKYFPVKGRRILFTSLAAFWGSIYLFLFWLICPLAALEMFLLLMLVPLFCAASFSAEENNTEKSGVNVLGYISDSVVKTSVLSGLLVAFAIIREPLAYCSLSLPGSYRGMIIFIHFNSNLFFPVGIFAPSAGALLLLGFIISLYQYVKEKNFPGAIK